MTEDSWLAAGDPRPLMAWLMNGGERPSARKCELLADALSPETRPWGHPRTSPHWLSGWCHYQGDRGLAAAADTFRDMVGNPFRPVPAGWRTPQLGRLAILAYDEPLPCPNCLGRGIVGAPERARLCPTRLGHGRELDPALLGIVADALEDGPHPPELLLALRGWGQGADGAWAPHGRQLYRGFWALDLILGRS